MSVTEELCKPSSHNPERGLHWGRGREQVQGKGMKQDAPNVQTITTGFPTSASLHITAIIEHPFTVKHAGIHT